MKAKSARPARRRPKISVGLTETDLAVQPPVPSPPAVDYKDGNVNAWWFRRAMLFVAGMGIVAGAAWLFLNQPLYRVHACFVASIGFALMATALLDKPYWVFSKQNPLRQVTDYQDTYTYTKAVGVTFTNKDGSCRQWIIRGLNSGETLVFIWDRWNKFSRHALAILTLDGRQVGYMRDEMASEFTPHVRRGVAYHVWVKAVTGREHRRNHGVNIGIDELNPGTPEAHSILWWSSYATWRWRNRLANTACRWLYATAVLCSLVGLGYVAAPFLK